MKHATITALSPTGIGARAQQPQTCRPKYAPPHGRQERQVLGELRRLSHSPSPLATVFPSNSPLRKCTLGAAEHHGDRPSCLWSQTPKLPTAPHRHPSPQPFAPLNSPLPVSSLPPAPPRAGSLG